jgi:hypothetical protein
VKSKWRELRQIVYGILAANIIGGLAAWLLMTLARAASNWPMGASVVVAQTIGISSLFALPVAMGIVAAYVWRSLDLSKLKVVGLSLVTALVGLGGAYVFWGEGLVCLLIGGPLLFLLVLTGALLGQGFFYRSPNRLNILVLPLAILAALVDNSVVAHKDGVVTDQIVIAAPAAEVWKHVVAFPRITSAPDYWLNRVGLPAAAETTCEGEFVGARRECIFSNGLVFTEIVAEVESQRLLTFDVVEQPSDPELLGHVTLHRGQFELQTNGDGTTTLIGRSWYTLHVRPLWYFDWWTRDITRHVHLRVMNHIKALSEGAP